MTKRMIWTLFAVAAAGITVYLVRNRRSHVSEEPGSDHVPVKKHRKHMSAGLSKEKAYDNGGDLDH